MKKTLLIALAVFGAVPAFAQDIDITVTDGKIVFKVRGSGGFVCSAQDSFKKIPVLGRGATKTEAEMNAKVAASFRAGNDGNIFFSNIISCEPSASGNGKITMVSDNNGTRISVEGPSAYQCIAQDTFRNVPFIASAATQTESSALASSACAADAGDSGFFCDTNCEKVSGGNGGVSLPPIKIPRIRFPRL